MDKNITDRIVSSLAYFSFGIFGLIWIIYANVAKKHMSSFLLFNLSQAIFISLVLTILAYLFDIAVNLLSIVPYVGKIVQKFYIFVNHNPIYFGFTITGFIVTLIVLYLVIFSLLGEKPRIACNSWLFLLTFNDLYGII